MRITVIGYGEVGRILAEDLRAQGLAVAAYDLKLRSEAGEPMREHALCHGVVLGSSHAQAVRLATPPSVGFLVQLIKNTSLAAVIGFVELTREGQLTSAATFQPFWVYTIVAALYFSLCFPLTRLSRRLERTLRVAR